MATPALSVATSNPRHLCNASSTSKIVALPLSSLPCSHLSALDSKLEASPPPWSTSPSTSSWVSTKRAFLQMGFGFLASSMAPVLDANATRIQYYATVGEPLCDLTFVKSGLGYCDVAVGAGVPAPLGELINVHYTARFADGTVFDSSYKRGRPLTMRIGAGKVLPGLDQGILGGGGVPPMLVGGKRKLMIPPKLAYGPEPAGCFSGDCNVPGNATLLYDILFVAIYK